VLGTGDENRYSELMKGFPLGRAARPREIADMTVFLASDRSAYTSGVIVTGYINLTRLVHADMKARNQGVVVNIIGAAGERFNYDYITGSAGNAALTAFTKSLGGKSSQYGVRIAKRHSNRHRIDQHWRRY
jgi:NAD(P)-dependent dehydrogenase (short-subunit alcohol dehydrogenase family)